MKDQRSSKHSSLAGTLISYAVWAQAAVTSVLVRVILGRRNTDDSANLNLSEVKSILIVRLDEIGDLVMFSPFLRGLRQHLPEAHITLVVKPGVRNLVERCPYVNEVLVFDQSGGRVARFLTLPWRAFRFAARHLRKNRYDLAILPRWDADYYYAAFVAFWSGAALRVGYSEAVTPYKRRVNRGFDRLLTHALDDRAVRHDVEHNSELLRFLGRSADDDHQEVWTDEDDQRFAENTLREHGIGPDGILIGMGPSGGHSALKQWPLEKFAEAGRWLQETRGAKIAIFGGPGEEPLGNALAEALGPGAINLVGRTTLRQMAALLGRCRTYVGNDSGPTHIAAATGVPVVAIFGSSCPHRFQPGGNTTLLWRDLACGPCQTTHHILNRCRACIFDEPHCLTEISAEEVQRAVVNSLLSPLRRLPMKINAIIS